MNITKSQSEAMSSKPLPIVASYACGKQIVTINLNVKEQASTARTTPDEGGETNSYQCTTLSFAHDGRITAEEVIRQVVKSGLFGSLDAEFLKGFVRWFAISDYDALAAILVSGRYTYPEELSCHRKALLGNKQPLEELNAYVEQCKALAVQVLPKDGE